MLQKKSLFLKHRETCVDVHVTVFITVTLQTSNSPAFDFKAGLDFDPFASNSH